MLVRFSSKTGATVSMFEKDARHMLKLMRHSGAIPSAILAEDVGGALENLMLALQNDAPKPAEGDEATKGDDNYISASTRAHPLIELLKRAQSRQETVMWDFDNNLA